MIGTLADHIEPLHKADSSTKILVYCVQGISRSASVVIAYLIRHANMTLKVAYEHVQGRRQLARPRDVFVTELQSIEKSVFGFEHPTLQECELPAGTIKIRVDPASMGF